MMIFCLEPECAISNWLAQTRAIVHDVKHGSMHVDEIELYSQHTYGDFATKAAREQVWGIRRSKARMKLKLAIVWTLTSLRGRPTTRDHPCINLAGENALSGAHCGGMLQR